MTDTTTEALMPRPSDDDVREQAHAAQKAIEAASRTQFNWIVAESFNLPYWACTPRPGDNGEDHTDRLMAERERSLEYGRDKLNNLPTALSAACRIM